MRLPELLVENQVARKIWEKGLRKGWEDIDGVLYRENLLYFLDIIRTEIIIRYHDDSLADYFGVRKTRELSIRKYHWSTLQADIKTYVKECDVCIVLKAMRHKLYGDLQSLTMPTHYWKGLSMDFFTALLVSTNEKGEIYDYIFVIVDRLTMMVYYESIKVTIDASGLVEVLLML